MSFSPRQADVLICAGRLPFKLAPVIRRIWDQMPQPKWSISMGACASTGGIFDNYSMVQGIDTIIPVDVYVPGCPPRPEGLMYGILLLQKKIKGETIADDSLRDEKLVGPVGTLPPAGAGRRAQRAVRELRSADPILMTQSAGPSRAIVGRWPPSPPPRSPALRSEFGPAVERHLVSSGQTVVYVSRDRSHDVLAWLKDTPGQEFNYLTDVTAVDYRDPERPLEVVYQLRSLGRKADLRVKVALDKRSPLEVRSVYDLWRGADWLEREVYDMFGVTFTGHPDLRRILMWETYAEGYPLRKDFPLRGHFSRAEQTRQALAANPEAHYSLEELSIADAYGELPEDMQERLATGRAGVPEMSAAHGGDGAGHAGRGRRRAVRPGSRSASPTATASTGKISAPSTCWSISAPSTRRPTACSGWCSSSRARPSGAASLTSAICTPASRSWASTASTTRSSR